MVLDMRHGARAVHRGRSRVRVVGLAVAGLLLPVLTAGPAGGAGRPAPVWDEVVVQDLVPPADLYYSATDLSRNGRYAVYSPTEGGSTLFVQDRLTGVTRSVSSVPNRYFRGDFSAYVGPEGRFLVLDQGNWADSGVYINSSTWIHDLRTGADERVDLPPEGGALDGCQRHVVSGFSADGRDVLLTGVNADSECDHRPPPRVYVHDADTDRTEVLAAEGVGAGMSADGTRVLYAARTASTLGYELFVRDLPDGEPRPVVVGRSGQAPDGGSGGASLSANGRFVLFSSSATNLVPGDTNESIDVFVRDLRTGVTQRVSLTDDGRQISGNSAPLSGISADGRIVGFTSPVDGIAAGDPSGTQDVFVRDRGARTTHHVVSGGGGRLTQDGRHVLHGLQVIEAAGAG